MTSLDTHWSRALRKVERAAQDATTPDGLTSAVGHALAEAVEADAHVFLRLDPLTALWLDATGAGYDAQACHNFNTQIFLRSPHADYGRMASQPERVLRLARDTVDAHDPYARHYFDAFDFAEDLHVLFAAAGQSFGHLTLGRRTPSFAPGAQRMLEQCVAPVTSALKRLLAKETLEAVPGDHVGLLFVDADGHVTPANALGEEVFSRNLALDPWRTRTALAAVCEIARRDLASPSGQPLPRVVYVEPGTQRRYRLVPERMTAPAGARPQALLMLEPIRALDSVELLRTAGLSEREAEVAIITLRGFKSGEAADAIGMSEHTFLTHLKSVYRKLGVSSRSELASLILAGAK